jgi:hypothetical protein
VTKNKLTIDVDATTDDKLNGKKCDPHACMYRVSMARALYTMFPGENNHHRVKVDAGHLRFIHDDHNWLANTPRLVSSNLQKFDASLHCKACKSSEGGFCEKHDIHPHKWKCKAVRGRKIRHVVHTRARQDQINVARKARAAAGRRDGIYALRRRVVGFT